MSLIPEGHGLFVIDFEYTVPFEQIEPLQNMGVNGSLGPMVIVDIVQRGFCGTKEVLRDARTRGGTHERMMSVGTL